MRLAYVSQGYSPHDLRFLRAFVEQGLHVCFVSYPGSQRETRPLPEGVAHLAVPATRGRSTLRQLRDWKPDLMLAGPLHTGGLFASILREVPLVAMSHGFDLLYALPGNAAARRHIVRALNRACGFFADCPALLAEATRLRTFAPEQTICLPWGLDGEPDRTALARGSDLRRSLGWENNIVLVSLRNWEAVYAIPEFLAAFARSAAENPELRLILGGAGSRRAEVEQSIRDLGLGDRIYCPGSVPESEVWTLLGAADGYVSSARSDGSSITLLQAMAIGLPALVHDTGGNRDWITEGVHGWFFHVDEPASLQKAIAAFLAARSHWPAITRDARDKVQSEANWLVSQKRLVEFLQATAQRAARVAA